MVAMYCLKCGAKLDSPHIQVLAELFAPRNIYMHRCQFLNLSELKVDIQFVVKKSVLMPNTFII